jgi:hypothetical protein
MQRPVAFAPARQRPQISRMDGPERLLFCGVGGSGGVLLGHRRKIVLVEQRVAECLEIADRAYVLQTGRVIMNGTAQEICDNSEIRYIWDYEGGGHTHFTRI